MRRYGMDDKDLAEAFEHKYPRYKSYRFEFEYPGYFTFSNHNNIVKFSPDNNTQGKVDVSVYDLNGDISLEAKDETYHGALDAEQLFQIVKPTLDAWEHKASAKTARIANRILDKIARDPDQDINNRSFHEWLDDFISEKGIDLEQGFTVPGPSGENHMTYGTVIEHMKIAPRNEQNELKKMMVKLDFRNAAIEPYLRHLAQALVL